MSRTTYNYKRKAISAAKDFRYGDDVLLKLKSANTEAEIAHIMASARKASCDY